ncbi:MAG: YraN family protein [Eubacteriales bacterium]|nr:YraN family protein [Eubacteriales bacterium]
MTNGNHNAYEKGVLGEARALAYLSEKGMVPLQTRYHSPFGEIDLIMTDGTTLALIEVKMRARGHSYDGISAVDRKKQDRIILTARHYLAEHPWNGAVRFDIVEITADGVQHIIDAFQGSEW